MLNRIVEQSPVRFDRKQLQPKATTIKSPKSGRKQRVMPESPGKTF